MENRGHGSLDLIRILVYDLVTSLQMRTLTTMTMTIIPRIVSIIPVLFYTLA